MFSDIYNMKIHLKTSQKQRKYKENAQKMLNIKGFTELCNITTVCNFFVFFMHDC